MNGNGVLLQSFVNDLQLKHLTDVEYKNRCILSQDINRPGIQLTGFFDHYDSNRIQIIGFVEMEYLKNIDEKVRVDVYEKLLRSDVPCIIFSRNLQPDKEFIDIANRRGIPVFSTSKVTTAFMSDVIRWLNVKLAPTIVIHGCLVDVSGVGVLIRGESGVGKSEAVLELIRRGHRLVADDAVEIHKVGDNSLYGNAPEITRDFIEIRGIGIVDIKELYGYEAIKETQSIDMIITLEEWDKEKEYDRIGLDTKYGTILDTKVVEFEIPIKPGRNLAVIVEAAAVYFRQRKAGYNPAERFIERSMEKRKLNL